MKSVHLHDLKREMNADPTLRGKPEKPVIENVGGKACLAPGCTSRIFHGAPTYERSLCDQHRHWKEGEKTHGDSRPRFQPLLIDSDAPGRVGRPKVSEIRRSHLERIEAVIAAEEAVA